MERSRFDNGATTVRQRCDCVATVGATAAERQWSDTGGIAVQQRSDRRSDRSRATVEQYRCNSGATAERQQSDSVAIAVQQRSDDEPGGLATTTMF